MKRTIVDFYTKGGGLRYFARISVDGHSDTEIQRAVLENFSHFFHRYAAEGELTAMFGVTPSSVMEHRFDFVSRVRSRCALMSPAEFVKALGDVDNNTRQWCTVRRVEGTCPGCVVENDGWSTTRHDADRCLLLDNGLPVPHSVIIASMCE